MYEWHLELLTFCVCVCAFVCLKDQYFLQYVARVSCVILPTECIMSQWRLQFRGISDSHSGVPDQSFH